MDADAHFPAGWLGHRAVAAIKAGASEESLKRMTRSHGEAIFALRLYLSSPAGSITRLLGRRVRALLGDGAPHHEHDCDKRDGEHGKHEEGVKICERGGLLLAQVVE